MMAQQVKSQSDASQASTQRNSVIQEQVFKASAAVPTAFRTRLAAVGTAADALKTCSWITEFLCVLAWLASDWDLTCCAIIALSSTVAALSPVHSMVRTPGRISRESAGKKWSTAFFFPG